MKRKSLIWFNLVACLGILTAGAIKVVRGLYTETFGRSIQTCSRHMDCSHYSFP